MSDDPATALTLTELIRRRAAVSPHATYVTLFDETVTYERLWTQSGRYARGLARAGLRAGDRVALIYPTCVEFFHTYVGCLRAGAVPVPLYPTLGVQATAGILRHVEAAAVATIGWFRREVDEAAALAPSVRAVLEPVDLEVDGGPPPAETGAPDDLALIQYTSGSTGQPRGVMLTHANLLSTIRFMTEAARLTPEDRVVSWLPLYHDMGLIGCAFTPPLTGAPVWLLPPDLRHPRTWVDLITRVRATFTVSPDFGYRNCVRHVRDTTGVDLSSLEAALSGAETVRPSTASAFEAHFGLKDVIAPCYGLAEATLAVAIWPRGTPRRLDAGGRALSVGRPCRGVEVCITTPGTDAAAPPAAVAAGVEGEICVRSPGVMRGYWADPPATARVLGRDGWLRSGDLGFVDDAGYLFVTGRLKDLVVVAGRNVAPADLEAAVDQVPGVRYSAAVGIESERVGSQRLYVVVEVRESVDVAAAGPALVGAVVNAVRTTAGLRPARVLLVTPGTLPKTSSGKLQRARLAAMITGDELRARVLAG
jgi:acyl-CoA synthetase (AMP-forming)/AMP-acid ligase II